METVLLTIPLKPFAIIPKIVLQQRNSASRHKKLEPLVKWASEVFYPLFLFYNSSESSESIHICKLPSRYNLAYSKGSSTANEVSAHSDPYVVFRFFSALQRTQTSFSFLLYRTLPSPHSLWLHPSPLLQFPDQISHGKPGRLQRNPGPFSPP